MKIGYYPGCSLSGTGREYEKSLKKILKDFSVELEEINDWVCCGATSGHVLNHRLALSLSAQNLMQASKQGLKEILAPCAACYNRLVVTRNELLSKPELRKEIEGIIGEEIKDMPVILNIVELFDKVGVDVISALKKVDMSPYNAACYYGCLLVRPASITKFDDAEQPTSMENLLQKFGIKSVDWNYKVECCGGSHSIARKDIVVDLGEKIIRDAEHSKANVMVVACPMCHSNLDMRQLNMKRKYKDHKDFPVLYITELIGLALGYTPRELGIDLHFIEFKGLKAAKEKEVQTA
jgi:heterodisulfide reductase subunit B